MVFLRPADILPRPDALSCYGEAQTTSPCAWRRAVGWANTEFGLSQAVPTPEPAAGSALLKGSDLHKCFVVALPDLHGHQVGSVVACGTGPECPS